MRSRDRKQPNSPPTNRGQAEEVRREKHEAVDSVPGRGETVLVLEDDPDVRNMVEAMITGLGYQVVTAPTAADARAALQSQNIDVVLSDVVLPGGINGPAFAQEARRLHPGLTIIFMSGYPTSGVAPNSELGPDEVLLNKPFKRHELATVLHHALMGK